MTPPTNPKPPTVRKRRPRKSKATTTFTLPAGDHRPRYELLVDLLRQQVDAGVFKPGDRVPSVRQFIRDLNVSHTTVTRALRTLVEDGTLEAKVGSGTRVAIRKQKKAIGILGLTNYTDMVKSAFMMRTLNLLQQRVLETGRTLIYRHINPDNPAANNAEDLSQIDGLFLVGHFPADASSSLAHAVPPRMPIVGMSCQDTGQFPVFTSDNQNDSARLIQYLASLGHKRIATLYMDPGAYRLTSHLRISSVKKALRKLNLPHDDSLFINGSVEEQVQNLLKLRPRPTAIFIASGIHRFPIIFDALKNTPLDLSSACLVAAYDEDLWTLIAPKAIEHVRIDQPLTELVNLTFDTLERMINQPPDKPVKIKSQVRPSRIVHVRANGDAAAVNP